MATSISSFILLAGSLGCGSLSAIAANHARENNLPQSKLWNLISAGVAGILIFVTLFLVVKGHTGAGEVASAVEELAVGVMISFVVMMIAMVGIVALNVLGFYEADKKDKKKTEWFSIGAAGLAFFSFVLSLLIIIFLL